MADSLNDLSFMTKNALDLEPSDFEELDAFLKQPIPPESDDPEGEDAGLLQAENLKTEQWRDIFLQMSRSLHLAANFPENSDSLRELYTKVVFNTWNNGWCGQVNGNLGYAPLHFIRSLKEEIDSKRTEGLIKNFQLNADQLEISDLIDQLIVKKEQELRDNIKNAVFLTAEITDVTETDLKNYVALLQKAGKNDIKPDSEDWKKIFERLNALMLDKSPLAKLPVFGKLYAASAFEAWNEGHDELVLGSLKKAPRQYLINFATILSKKINAPDSPIKRNEEYVKKIQDFINKAISKAKAPPRLEINLKIQSPSAIIGSARETGYAQDVGHILKNALPNIFYAFTNPKEMKIDGFARFAGKIAKNAHDAAITYGTEIPGVLNRDAEILKNIRKLDYFSEEYINPALDTIDKVTNDKIRKLFSKNLAMGEPADWIVESNQLIEEIAEISKTMSIDTFSQETEGSQKISQIIDADTADELNARIDRLKEINLELKEKYLGFTYDLESIKGELDRIPVDTEEEPRWRDEKGLFGDKGVLYGERQFEKFQQQDSLKAKQLTKVFIEVKSLKKARIETIQNYISLLQGQEVHQSGTKKVAEPQSPSHFIDKMLKSLEQFDPNREGDKYKDNLQKITAELKQNLKNSETTYTALITDTHIRMTGLHPNGTEASIEEIKKLKRSIDERYINPYPRTLPIEEAEIVVDNAENYFLKFLALAGDNPPSATDAAKFIANMYISGRDHDALKAIRYLIYHEGRQSEERVPSNLAALVREHMLSKFQEHLPHKIQTNRLIDDDHYKAFESRITSMLNERQHSPRVGGPRDSENIFINLIKNIEGGLMYPGILPDGTRQYFATPGQTHFFEKPLHRAKLNFIAYALGGRTRPTEKGEEGTLTAGKEANLKITWDKPDEKSLSSIKFIARLQTLPAPIRAIIRLPTLPLYPVVKGVRSVVNLNNAKTAGHFIGVMAMLGIKVAVKKGYNALVGTKPKELAPPPPNRSLAPPPPPEHESGNGRTRMGAIILAITSFLGIGGVAADVKASTPDLKSKKPPVIEIAGRTIPKNKTVKTLNSKPEINTAEVAQSEISSQTSDGKVTETTDGSNSNNSLEVAARQTSEVQANTPQTKTTTPVGSIGKGKKIRQRKMAERRAAADSFSRANGGETPGSESSPASTVSVISKPVTVTTTPTTTPAPTMVSNGVINTPFSEAVQNTPGDQGKERVLPRSPEVNTDARYDFDRA